MPRPSLAPRDRRALLVGGPVLAAGLAWVLGVAPALGALQRATAQLAAERDLLERETALLAAVPRFEAARAAGSAQLLQAARRLFGGADERVAGTDLAQYLQAGASASRVLLTRVDPAPPREAGPGLLALALRVQGESDLQGVLTLLYSLESGLRLVRIDDLRLQAPRGRTAAAADAPEVLHVQFTATGYMLAQPADRPAPPPAAGRGAP